MSDVIAVHFGPPNWPNGCDISIYFEGIYLGERIIIYGPHFSGSSSRRERQIKIEDGRAQCSEAKIESFRMCVH